jgi:hypothetical protein
MKRWLAALAVCSLFVVSVDAQAAPRRTYRNYGPTYRSSSQGPLARFMEFERRKNAALRAMFFGG